MKKKTTEAKKPSKKTTKKDAVKVKKAPVKTAQKAKPSVKSSITTKKTQSRQSAALRRKQKFVADLLKQKKRTEVQSPPDRQRPTADQPIEAKKASFVSTPVTPDTATKYKEHVVGAPAAVPEFRKDLKPIELDAPISVKDLAIKIQEKPSVLIKYLIEQQKMFVTINQLLNEDIVIQTLAHFGYGF